MKRLARISWWEPRVRRGWPLIAAAVVTGLLLAAALIYRSTLAAQTDTQICRKIHHLDTALEGLVASSTERQALLKFQYYRRHPGELEVVIESGKSEIQILRAADCRPATLPTHR